MATLKITSECLNYKPLEEDLVEVDGFAECFAMPAT